MAERTKRYAAGLTRGEIAARSRTGRALKLDSNENPLGCSPAASEAMVEAVAQAHRYPPAVAEDLHEALGRRFGVDARRVVSSAGSVRILEILLRQVCGDGRGMALAFTPCFPALAHRARQAGVGLRQIPLDADYAMDLNALARAADEETALVYVANPDNPTGRVARADELAELAHALPRRTLLVVDEAYVDFVDDPESTTLMPLLDELQGVAVVRTFSKAYGLAGARVGFGVLPPDLAEAVDAAEVPFSVSVPALAGALAALDDEAFRLRSVETVRAGRGYLEAELDRLDCRPVPSQGSFVMFRPPVDASMVFRGLMERGVAVRPLDYAGLPRRLRVSVGAKDENRAFVKALEEVLQGTSPQKG